MILITIIAIWIFLGAVRSGMAMRSVEIPVGKRLNLVGNKKGKKVNKKLYRTLTLQDFLKAPKTCELHRWNGLCSECKFDQDTWQLTKGWTCAFVVAAMTLNKKYTHRPEHWDKEGITPKEVYEEYKRYWNLKEMGLIK